MDILSYVVGAVAAIVLVYANVIADVHRDTGLWINCIGTILLVISGFCFVQDLYWKKDAAASKPISGVLTPGNGKSREIEKIESNIPEARALVLLGDTIAIAVNRFPFVVIRQEGESVLAVSACNPAIQLNANFFDVFGNSLCEIVNNRFNARPTPPYRYLVGPHSLQIQNDASETILRVEFLNPTTVKVSGDFCMRGGEPIHAGEELKIATRTLAKLTISMRSPAIDIVGDDLKIGGEPEVESS